MIVIVCVDDNLGMMFNKRRQSRDGAVIKQIFELTGENPLFIHEYSAPLFDAQRVTVKNDMLQVAADGDYCFVENLPLKEYRDKIRSVILFRWNRVYPADVKLDIPLEMYRKTEVKEFIGTSHERITQEVYIR